MKIRTGGRPTQYTVHKGVFKKKRLRLSTVGKAKADTGISDSKMLRFMSHFREDLGQDYIEPGLAQYLIASNHLFELPTANSLLVVCHYDS